MTRGRSGGSTPALVRLREAGVAFTEHPYRHDPRVESYGLEAAEALGLDPSSVFKTLVAHGRDAAGRPEPVVAVIPVTCQLDLKALAGAIGRTRARLADPATAQRLTGYPVGGISPFGQRTRSLTVLDRSATGLPTMYVSGGRRGLDVGIAPDDLIRLTGALVADVSTPRRRTPSPPARR